MKFTHQAVWSGMAGGMPALKIHSLRLQTYQASSIYDLRMGRKPLWLILLIFLPLALLTCGRPASQRKVLRVGFVPSENVQQVTQNAQPIVQILEKKLAVEVQSFVATDYTGVVEALRANKLDISFLRSE